MIGFLKKLFQKEEEQAKTEEVSFNDLDRWIKSNSGYFTEQARQDARKIIVDLNVKLNRLNWSAEVLKNAELQNSNIPMKAKQLMEGNREYYANAVMKWAQDLKYGNNFEFNELRDFIKKFNESLDSLNKSTVKSYTILQEFFANESSKVASILKDADETIKSLDSRINSRKIQDVERIKSLMAEIKSRLKLKQSLEQEQSAAGKELEELKKKKEELLKDTEAFKQSESFVKYRNLRQERDSLLKSVDSCEDVITQSFAAIERPLRKYSHVAFEHEQIVLNYIASPLDALVGDKKLVILDILEKTKENIEKGILKLESAKKEKAIEEIGKMGRNFLMQILEDYTASMKRIKDIDRQIKELNLSLIINDYNSKLNNLDFSIKNLEKDFNKIMEKTEKLDIGGLVRNLEETIKSSFSEVKVRI